MIAVVLFHFDPTWLPGGFAGVDVFFVISGFLMTRIIFGGLAQQNFCLWQFYLARGRRIIPALAVMCLTLLVLGYLFIAPWDYRLIGRDVATSMWFVSSLMFSMRGGYFDSAENFLLHTWSLSTEWQFYMIYPLLLLILARYMTVERLKSLVLGLTLVGFAFCVYATEQWPDPSYYLLPMRAWEMLLGGVAYLYPMKIVSQTARRYLEWLGIGLILLSYGWLSEDHAWPGYLALIPLMGVFLLIQVQRQDSWFTTNIFCEKIGQWSYSIYLWHWPIAVLFSYYALPSELKPLAIGVSVFLGYSSYRWLEQPTQRRQRTNLASPANAANAVNEAAKSTNIRRSMAAYVSLMLLCGGLGSLVYFSQGFAQRMNLTANPLIQGGTMDDHLIRRGVYLLNTQRDYDYILLGDSTANHYVRGILAQGTRIKHAWYDTCLSFPQAMSTREGHYLEWQELCKNNYKVPLNDETPVIMAANWLRADQGSLQCVTEDCQLSGEYRRDLPVQLHSLIQAYGVQRPFYLIGQLPSPVDNQIVKCLRTNHYLRLGLTCPDRAQPAAAPQQINQVLRDVAIEYANVTFIDPGDALCDNGQCIYAIEQQSIFMMDAFHLSGFGSEVVWRYLIKAIDTGAHHGPYDS